MTKTVKMSPKDVAKNKNAQMYYYRLKKDSECGMTFLSVVGGADDVERRAIELAESVGASEIIQSPFYDFGGIGGFLFPKRHKPDEEVFRETGETSDDGRKIYEVAADAKICLVRSGNIPEENAPGVLQRKYNLSYYEIANSFSRKEIARAIGLHLNYLHPLEALRLLDMPRKDIEGYVSGAKKMEDMLKHKLCKNTREEKLKELAVFADTEQHLFLEQAQRYTYGTYMKITGSEKAVQLCKEVLSLPVIPSGTLNHVVGLDGADNRCGFFIMEDSIWIQSHARSCSADRKDLCLVESDVWNMALKDLKKHSKQNEENGKNN